MTIIYRRDGVDYAPWQAFKITRKLQRPIIDDDGNQTEKLETYTDEIQYPPGWLTLATDADLAALGFKKIETRDPPDTVEEIADWQFWGQLRSMGIITDKESLAAIGTGAIPAMMDKAISALKISDDQKMDMREQITGATVFRRHGPTTEMLRQIMKLSVEDTDALWLTASQRGA